MNQRRELSNHNHNKQNQSMLPLYGRETNTGAQQIGDQIFPFNNQPIFIAQNEQIVNCYGEVMPVCPPNTGPVVKLPTDYVAQQVAASQTVQFHQQQQTHPFYYQHQYQEQANYQEFLRQCSQSAMQQLMPIQVPISTENGQMTYVIMHVPLWALTAQIPGLVMSSMEPFLQTLSQDMTDIYPNGQIQQFYPPMQQNGHLGQNVLGIQELPQPQQVQEPLNLTTERTLDPVNRQEQQQMRSPTVDVVIMPRLGNGLIN